MKKRPSLLSTAFICLLTSAGINTTANAAELSQTTSAKTTANSLSNIDYVLGELTRQHDNASSLVKLARQPVSLSANSSLISNSHKIDTESLIGRNQTDEDVLKRLTAVASNSVSRFKQSGLASWYGKRFHGRPTASGERFNMNAMTAAHSSLPFNSYLKVTNKSNGQSVVVKVNDRSPAQSSRVLDLSYGAAKKIGLANVGVGNVAIERVSAP